MGRSVDRREDMSSASSRAWPCSCDAPGRPLQGQAGGDQLQPACGCTVFQGRAQAGQHAGRPLALAIGDLQLQCAQA